MNRPQRWILGREEKILVGMLYCQRCQRETDVMVGGKEMTRTGDTVEHVCPRCGERDKAYWVNRIRPVEAEGRIFVVDEEPA